MHRPRDDDIWDDGKARAGVLYSRSLLIIYFMYSSVCICQLLNDMVFADCVTLQGWYESLMAENHMASAKETTRHSAFICGRSVFVKSHDSFIVYLI